MRIFFASDRLHGVRAHGSHAIQPSAPRSLDQRNPRTASRHLLVSKIAGRNFTDSQFRGVFTGRVSNQSADLRICAVALALIFFYSVTKRFTSATHFFLGLALAIAPIGAWIAQTGRIHLAPIVLAVGVLCGVAGFDLIYATQDYDSYGREKIRSLVVKLGITPQLASSAAITLNLHVCGARRVWIRCRKLGALN